MHIATLNIQHGGGKRIKPILEFLKELNSDVIVLTEYHLDDQGLGARLRDIGYSHQQAGSALPKENSVFIASRESFEVIGTSQRIASVKLKDFILFGVYFPQGEAKRDVYDRLKREVADCTSPALVIGDFNTGIHYLDETGKSFICAESFESLKNLGLIDSWRSRNPNTVEFSWYSNQGNGFRIDHAFCSESLNSKVINIFYNPTPREQKFSDHSALEIEINLNPPMEI